MVKPKRKKDKEGECVVPSHALPANELDKYSVFRDPHTELDIARYVR